MGIPTITRQEKPDTGTGGRPEHSERSCVPRGCLHSRTTEGPNAEFVVTSIRADFRAAWRGLARHRAFSLAAVATVALIIGANAGVFNVVNGILLRPLPFPRPSQLVALCEFPEKERDSFCVTSPPNAADLGRESSTLAAVGLGRDWPVVMRGPDGAVSVTGGLASPALFTLLGVRLERGRAFAPDEIGAGAKVALVSHRFWQEQLGGRADVLEHPVILNDETRTIVGVLDPDVRIPTMEDIDAWLPIPFSPSSEENRTWRGFRAFARLKSSATIDDARRDVSRLAGGLQTTHFADKPDWGIEVRPVQDLIIGSARGTLLTFLGAVTFVLLIGCANLANLYLARNATRAREYALRAALGAPRWALARGVLVESLVIAVVGGALGLLAGTWLSRLFVALAPRDIPRLDAVHVDARVTVFVIGLSLLTGLLVGVLPAIRSGRADVRSQLGDGVRTSSMRGTPLGRLLVALEIALAVVLVTGAGLLIRSLATLGGWSPGIPLDRVTTTWLLASQSKYPTSADVAQLFARARDGVATLPGVEAAGEASAGPLFGGTETDLAIADGAQPAEQVRGTVRWFDVGPGYFATLGVPVVRGRDIAATDVAGGPLVAVINERLAARFWPNADPVGRRLRLPDDSATFAIVGVVKDVPAANPNAPVEPQIYWSNRQRPRWATYLIIRTANPAAIAREVGAFLATLDPDLQVSSFATLAARAQRQLVRPRFNAAVIGIFSGLALVLAIIGVYGLQSYTVAQRTREFGVRMALGATPSMILREVLRTNLRTTAVALVAGGVAAVWLAGTLTPLLAGVSPSDSVSLVAAITILVVVSTAASLRPAQRASRVDPVQSLRQD